MEESETMPLVSGLGKNMMKRYTETVHLKEFLHVTASIDSENERKGSLELELDIKLDGEEN